VDTARAAVRSVGGRRDERIARDIGRSARLELVFALRQGRTVLAHAYAEPPFRVGHTFPDGDGLHLILALSAPGIFGGDRLSQHVTLERGARVRLTSQSALQAHPSPEPEEARLVSRFCVEAGAALSCEWDPLIPFPGASVAQNITIDLEGDASLYWSDAVMSGREARGERWLFGSLSHELRVVHGGILRYMERYRVRPEDDRPERPWVAGDACYFGTVLAVGPSFDTGPPGELHAELQAVTSVYSAVDRLDEALTLTRLTSASGVAFRKARAIVSGFSRTR